MSRGVAERVVVPGQKLSRHAQEAVQGLWKTTWAMPTYPTEPIQHYPYDDLTISRGLQIMMIIVS